MREQVDDPLVAAMAGRTAARVVTFGAGADADVRISDVVTDDLARPRFTLTTPSGSAPVRLGLSGAHHASNAAAVVAAATAAGISLSDAVSALEQVAAISPHRMQLRETDDGVVVIDDAYNANPDSMRAALRALTSMAAGRRRTWAVLGVMRELGPDAPALHAEVGAEAATLGVDELVVVGADAAPIADGAAAAPGWAGRARCATDVDEATALLRREVRRDDVVLVKASNSEQLWRVADLLARRATVEVNT